MSKSRADSRSRAESRTECWTSSGGAAARAHRLKEVGEAHALVRSEAMLATRLRNLKHALSDASLSGEHLQHPENRHAEASQSMQLTQTRCKFGCWQAKRG